MPRYLSAIRSSLVAKQGPAVGRLVEAQLLDHRPHGPVEDEDPPAGEALQLRLGFLSSVVCHWTGGAGFVA